jgi:hypothetical protein
MGMFIFWRGGSLYGTGILFQMQEKGGDEESKSSHVKE